MHNDQTLLVLLGIDFTYGRSLLTGILEEVRKHPGFRVRLVRSEKELREAQVSDGPYLATLGMIWDTKTVRRLKKLSRMTISFANKSPFPADRHVILNDRGIGTLGAREFIKLGITRLAAFQPESHFHLAERATGFRAGCECAGISRPPVLKTLDEAIKWIHSVSEPGGILATNDVHGRTVVDACEEEGIRIPADLSVIGVDDDDVYVHLGRRALSSVHLPFQEMGRMAVRMALGGGSEVGPELIELGPIEVVHRETTAMLADVPLIVRRYIEFLLRERPLPANVGEACARIKIPRRSLELACQRHLSQTPGDLLKLERLRLATRLEADGLEKQEIATSLGYAQVRSVYQLTQRREKGYRS
jgi:LacI family transcriptional regulator